MTEGALVLEGGSLRSVFTAGVLDILLEHKIELSYVNGVSAGAMCGINYVSKQPGRTQLINRNYLQDKRYVSLRNLLKNRLIFNFDFLFGELSNNLIPLDYDTFYQSEQRFEVVATRCRTGQPEFFEKGHCSDVLKAVRASASMPMLSKMVKINGKQYLDGGISLPIAYRKPIDEGYQKVVLVLTREQGYQKKVMSKWQNRAYQHYFKPLPQLLKSLQEIPDRYNKMQQEINQLEKAGIIFVIRPEKTVTVSRIEQNKVKLEMLYQEGRDVAFNRLTDLRNYLDIN